MNMQVKTKLFNDQKNIIICTNTQIMFYFSSPASYLSDTLDSWPVWMPFCIYQFYGSLVSPFITQISCKQYWSVSLGTAMKIEQCHANILLQIINFDVFQNQHFAFISLMHSISVCNLTIDKMSLMQLEAFTVTHTSFAFV